MSGYAACVKIAWSFWSDLGQGIAHFRRSIGRSRRLKGNAKTEWKKLVEMTDRMAILYALYAGEDRVQFLSFSVDPKTDTIPVLNLYAERFGIYDERWFLLSGAPDEIREFAEDGLQLSAGVPMGHSAKFVLVDPDGYVRGFYTYDNESSIELLKIHIRQLVRSGTAN